MTRCDWSVCTEEGRPPSVTEKPDVVLTSTTGERRSWTSPAHSIHSSGTHRKQHPDLLRRTSSASGNTHTFSLILGPQEGHITLYVQCCSCFTVVRQPILFQQWFFKTLTFWVIAWSLTWQWWWRISFTLNKLMWLVVVTPKRWPLVKFRGEDGLCLDYFLFYPTVVLYSCEA